MTFRAVATAQPSPVTRSEQPNRNAGIDALRALLTMLVVFHHSAITYGAIGGWFYREVPTDGRLETKLLILFCSVNQAFFMGLFFLIAGAFTPTALERRGPADFALERLLRLGVPTLAFCLLLGPVTNALAATARGRSFTGVLWSYWSHGRILEPGPLWFAWALLIFSAGYMLWSAAGRRTFRAPSPIPFPSQTALGIAALATGTAAFALRLVWPVGVNVLALQLGYFASYVALFAAGCAGSTSGWLTSIPDDRRRSWTRIAWFTFPVLPAVALAGPFVPALAGEASGGWSVPAFIYAFWEPFLAWGIILGLLARVSQAAWPATAFWRTAARRSYAIYIIHPPVLVGVAILWRTIEAPHIVKFAITGTVAWLVCYLMAGLLLWLPPIARIV